MSKFKKERFYGLEKGTYIRSTAWKCDFDEYSFQLDRASKEWLNTFSEAELKGCFRAGHSYSQDEKRDIWKDIYRAKNDLFSIQSCSNRIASTDDILEHSANLNPENSLISLIDYENEKKSKNKKRKK